MLTIDNRQMQFGLRAPQVLASVFSEYVRKQLGSLMSFALSMYWLYGYGPSAQVAERE